MLLALILQWYIDYAFISPTVANLVGIWLLLPAAVKVTMWLWWGDHFYHSLALSVFTFNTIVCFFLLNVVASLSENRCKIKSESSVHIQAVLILESRTSRGSAGWRSDLVSEINTVIKYSVYVCMCVCVATASDQLLPPSATALLYKNY